MSKKLESRIPQLYKMSEKILDESALENGAIISARNDSAYAKYSESAEDYHYSVLRDSAFQLLGAHAINPGKAADRAVNYVEWLNTNINPELDITAYKFNADGTPRDEMKPSYQPDQAGTFIGALDTVVPESHGLVDSTIETLSDELASKWNGVSFGTTRDIWMTRDTSEDFDDVFTYSLAASTYGLTCAVKRLPNAENAEKWQASRDEMVDVLRKSAVVDEEGKLSYRRAIYQNKMYLDNDNTVDASLAGLVYPYQPLESDNEAVINTLNTISNKLYLSYASSVTRFKDDSYNGLLPGVPYNNGVAGGWPSLTLWNVLSLNQLGEENAKRTAKIQYERLVHKLDAMYHREAYPLPENIIPQQIFDNSKKDTLGVMPYGWSSAMFILATNALKYND